MYIRKLFSPKSMFMWTRYETLFFTAVTIVEVGLFFLSEQFFQIPFTPVALIGTAVAFVIGFQSNAAYGRTWEARMIWGGIVNSSRTFGIMVQDFISNAHAHSPVSEEQLDDAKKTLVHRHIAWLTALRYAMRQSRPWEYIMQEHTNKEWAEKIYVPELQIPFEEAIRPYLSPEDWTYVSQKDNKQTAIMYLQSRHLTRLKDQKLIWEFSYLELQNVLEELVSHQGKSERIKNFPYPRQYASLLFYLTWIFILVLPISIAGQFADLGHKLSNRFMGVDEWFAWLSVPFSVTLMWIFYSMNRIGRVGENPFEGSANDVPISAIARGIEIDLRQNLGETKEAIPKPFEVRNDTQM